MRENLTKEQAKRLGQGDWIMENGSVTFTSQEAVTVCAALQWLDECLKSGDNFDMSHIEFGDDPLDGRYDILNLIKKIKSAL